MTIRFIAYISLIMIGWRVNMQFQLITFHYDAPFALKLFGHIGIHHDLTGVISHPELDSVKFRILQAGTVDVTLDHLFIFDAQSAKALSGVKLLMEYHASLFIVVVLQPKILRHGLLLELLVNLLLTMTQIIDLHYILMIWFYQHIRLYILIFKRE